MFSPLYRLVEACFLLAPLPRVLRLTFARRPLVRRLTLMGAIRFVLMLTALMLSQGPIISSKVASQGLRESS